MTAKMKRVVLLGLGRMGKNHFRILREAAGFELVAAIDAAEKPPFDLGGVRYAKSLSELDDASYDCAVVATPTVSHHQLALDLIARGKNLLVEKPIASSFALGQEVLLAAQKKGVRLAVGHVERFNPAVRKLREVLKAGMLGTPIHFAFTRVGGYPETILAGNNVILDLAVHDIDVLRSLVGPVRLEHAMSHVTWKPGVFDTAEMFLASQTGASATVHVNWVTPTKIRSLRVTGTRGVCNLDYMLQTCELLGGSLLANREPEELGFEKLQEIYRTTDRIQFGIQNVEPLKVQIGQVATFFDGGSPGELCTGADALAAVLIAERAMKLESGRSLPPPGTAEIGRVPTADDEWV